MGRNICLQIVVAVFLKLFGRSDWLVHQRAMRALAMMQIEGIGESL